MFVLPSTKPVLSAPGNRLLFLGLAILMHHIRFIKDEGSFPISIFFGGGGVESTSGRIGAELAKWKAAQRFSIFLTLNLIKMSGRRA